MDRFELELPIILAVSVVMSTWSLFRNSGNRIQLESDANEELYNSTPRTGKYLTEDAFDLSNPEDVLDGYSIDSERFWRRTQGKKLILSIIFALLVVVDTIHLGYICSIGLPGNSRRIPSLLLLALFDVYLLGVALFSIQQNTVEIHWSLIVNLAALTCTAGSLRFVSAIFPNADPLSTASTVLQWSALLLIFSSCMLVVNVPRGPPLYMPPTDLYSQPIATSVTPSPHPNVCAVAQSSVFDYLAFNYTGVVVRLAHRAESLEIRDLPIIPAAFRASSLFTQILKATVSDGIRERKAHAERTASETSPRKWWWQRTGSGWPLILRLARVNRTSFSVVVFIAAVTAILSYAPAWLLQRFLEYLQEDPDRKETYWGWTYCAGLVLAYSVYHLTMSQMWYIGTIAVQLSIKVQLNTLLFAKTLLRKDVAPATSSERAGSPIPLESSRDDSHDDDKEEEEDEDDTFATKQNVMTLMTTDVDRVSEFTWHVFSLVDAPIELIVGGIFLYHLLGSSCLVGLAVTCIFLPINHFASKYIVASQGNLMKARDERVSLMNEILGAIRMLKFMAWERNFEKRVSKIREKELKYQRQNFNIEVILNTLWITTPIIVTVVSFFHFTVIRHQQLSPAIAFTSVWLIVSIFWNKLRFALSALPETFIDMLEGFISVRRIERYLISPEVSKSQDIFSSTEIVLSNATVAWPQPTLHADRSEVTVESSGTPTPDIQGRFLLRDVSLNIPIGKLTLICGRLGSGKSLLLSALLGEADLLSGQIVCPRTPPDALASFASLEHIPSENWVVPGICAYVPQTAWLQNTSIKENILFSLPLDEKRYRTTLEACSLVADLKIIEGGDDAEIGERGVTLSGGQKARVSLARAVYSRASILFLDDVLSAVDSHTARHIYDHCLRGPLMNSRTVIMISHHVQLCIAGASYVVALDNGRVGYSGPQDGFLAAGLSSAGPIIHDLDELSSTASADVRQVASVGSSNTDIHSDIDSAQSTMADDAEGENQAVQFRAPRKLMEEERRSVGRIAGEVWLTYFMACGGWGFWTVYGLSSILGMISPVIEKGWLSHWSEADDAESRPLVYVGVYALVASSGILIDTIQWLCIYRGAINASTRLYIKLTQSVLFAKIRFHDTISRGRLLNRFGKDFETTDSQLADELGNTITHALSVITTFVTITWLGGPLFLIAASLLSVVYYNVASIYSQAARDLRRLDSVSHSPLYSLYGETISGVSVVRAFGASTKFIREMHQHVNANSTPFYWTWNVNQWMGLRFDLLASLVVGATAATTLMDDRVGAASAGFALSFAGAITDHFDVMIRHFVGLERSMVAVERINEFSILPQEPCEIIEHQLPASWPAKGKIDVTNLVIRYAPDLPDVLHGLTFSVAEGSKIGVLGRTGGGKSTLALSFFRFVEATNGRIAIDGINIADIGLTDLRSRLTIIPQDPTILSGTLRSTLDVFEEYEDVEIFEALRRVHLIPSDGGDDASEQTHNGDTNQNIFANLESLVSEGGSNFSAGEKQLICMARAILKKTKVLFMDEATASVDYATDELISQTIRREFANSTILTIAHRLRTIIDYDKVLILDQGHIIEFDQPHRLLSDPQSMFHAMCKATGPGEFAELKRMAEGATSQA